MNLSAPTQLIFIVSAVIAILAIVGTLTPLPFISANGFWTAILAYIVLALGNLLKGL